ncbi:hypothetical protein [Methanosphaerula palustris]|uniref:Uncharacterized protein n=1 Tax=Methanosphaerula palustris (strain ATCC BAA-1556 / DSM 19958 / E1-9c) TaxID=521011 RepID=B8GJS2_METPE|nr:hypothetical protein [Methanosphaerula palustris]ACL15726.1 hypothetical protein Mpal_0344 [Methanosphaerula palustris E1-9c]
MYRDRRIRAAIPVYNEELPIGETLASIPDFVDAIYGVNDCSKDRTQQTGGMRLAADPSSFPCTVPPSEMRTPASLEQIIEVR